MLFLGFLGVFGLAGPGQAEEMQQPGTGVLDAIGPDGAPLGACPLEHTAVSVEIAGFVARVRVTQRFANPFPDPIEAIYAFPLSERGAVDGMWIRTGDREIRGEIKRREEARRIYEQARERGQLAALLDQERPNIFTQQIANLMPGAEVEIVLEYVEPLRYEAGEFEFSFPTVVGPRFIPGRAAGRQGTGWSPDTSRVPDASRITPPVTPEGARSGHDLSIEVALEAGVPILGIDSRLHAVDVERDGKTRAVVSLRNQREIPNRDFVLRYAVAGDELESGYLVHRDGGDGYVTFVLLPPKRVRPADVAPRELVFVIDRSGSQSGRPLLKAKETMLWILDRLNPNDTFQIVDFSSSANFLFERPMPVTPETLRRARAHIRGLQANGGTMMAEAIQRVTERRADGNRLRIVTFMTDGYIGNDFEVISLVKRLRGTSRWFPFGTGNSVNRFLLEEMARHGGGEVEYVLLDASGDEVARKFYDRIDAPVLTDVRLEFRNLDVYGVYPNQLADVWEERPLVIHARYRKPGQGRVILRGYRAGEAYAQEIEVELPAREAGSDAIASMWARARVDDLMARDLRALQSGAFPDVLREEIIEVALEHRIMTQFTSFVAVEDRVINEGGQLRTVTVPVEMPQGVEYEGVFGDGPQPALAGKRAAGGMLSRMKSALGSGLLAPPALETADRAVGEPSLSRPADGDERRERDDGRALSQKARERLAPELRALVEGGSAPSPTVQVTNGRVRVRVQLREGAAQAVEALQEAGLEVDLILAGLVVGEIEVEKLAELAELDAVVRISAG
jgi:Ca-activated chloride channel family protein